MLLASCTATPESPAGVETTSGSTTLPAAERPTTTRVTEGDPFAAERLEMVDRQIAGRGVKDQVVLEAMRTTPRHRFVPDEWVERAYADHPLPIGYGQTISQPYIVGFMSEALGLQPGDTVLEIGTGSGYQAAVLADMGMRVFSIEIIPELAERAASDLEANGYTSVVSRQGDGYWGWAEEGPFHAIIVTAAPDHVPQPLVEQLAEGGRMVIPIGPVGAVQTLWRFSVDAGGELVAENLGPVRFVPLTRAEE